MTHVFFSSYIGENIAVDLQGVRRSTLLVRQQTPEKWISENCSKSTDGSLPAWHLNERGPRAPGPSHMENQVLLRPSRMRSVKATLNSAAKFKYQVSGYFLTPQPGWRFPVLIITRCHARNDFLDPSIGHRSPRRRRRLTFLVSSDGT